MGCGRCLQLIEPSHSVGSRLLRSDLQIREHPGHYRPEYRRGDLATMKTTLRLVQNDQADQDRIARGHESDKAGNVAILQVANAGRGLLSGPGLTGHAMVGDRCEDPGSILDHSLE